MKQKLILIVIAAWLLVNAYGCIAILAGAAGGAGTAAWLSGKLTQEVQAPYERTIAAAKKALTSLKLDLIKETREDAVTQLKSKYTDGKEVWIDVRRITGASSKIEVRVGVMSDREAADVILKRILRYL
ncbi:MAG: DUF3568 family protein [Candidatus Omnitrophica bacterium]|nr:DUF3568 family protein [Candidatus Omnitrophota bacterium]